MSSDPSPSPSEKKPSRSPSTPLPSPSCWPDASKAKAWTHDVTAWKGAWHHVIIKNEKGKDTSDARSMISTKHVREDTVKRILSGGGRAVYKYRHTRRLAETKTLPKATKFRGSEGQSVCRVLWTPFSLRLAKKIEPRTTAQDAQRCTNCQRCKNLMTLVEGWDGRQFSNTLP